MMRKIAFLLAVIMITSLLMVEAAPSRAKKPDTPKFTISIPRDKQILVGNAMTIQVFSPNTRIKRGAGRNKPDEGHLKVSIDGENPVDVYMTTYRKNIATLNEGKHTLFVELVQNNGISFSPAVTRQLEFGIQRTAVKAGPQPKPKKTFHPARLFSEKRI